MNIVRMVTFYPHWENSGGMQEIENQTIFKKDQSRVKARVEYAYDRFYDKRHGCMYPEIFVYGKNRNQYIEFQAWFLYAFAVVSSCIRKECV